MNDGTNADEHFQELLCRFSVPMRRTWQPAFLRYPKSYAYAYCFVQHKIKTDLNTDSRRGEIKIGTLTDATPHHLSMV